MNATTDGVVEIYLVRHGQTWFNKRDRVQGWCDSPLTEAGHELAAALGRGLIGDGIVLDAAYSGDMARHHETAQDILDAMGSTLPITQLKALREMSFGGWEGGFNTDMWRACWDNLGVGTDEEAFAKGLSLVDVYNGISITNPDPDYPAENTAAVADRAVAALNDIADTEAGLREHSRVLVVTSGITIVCLLTALGFPPGNRVRNGAVALLRRGASGWSAATVNDMSWAANGRAA